MIQNEGDHLTYSRLNNSRLNNSSLPEEFQTRAKEIIYSENAGVDDLKKALWYLKGAYLIQTKLESNQPTNKHVFFEANPCSIKLNAVKEILEEFNEQPTTQTSAEKNPRVEEAKKQGLLGELYAKLQKFREPQDSPSAAKNK